MKEQITDTMNMRTILLTLSLGAALLCATAPKSYSQNAPAQEALAEIIAAYQTGSGVFADSDAPASQAERFEGLGSELREIVDGLMP